MTGPRLRISSPAVIHERFENEVVAIHLDTGAYFSLMGTAADAFVLLSHDATAAELAEALAAKYAGTPAEIETALAPFLDDLQREQLIAVVETHEPPQALRIDGHDRDLPFVPPQLQAFHDLEGLLLLDPIHDVDDQGWPTAR